MISDYERDFVTKLFAFRFTKRFIAQLDRLVDHYNDRQEGVSWISKFNRTEVLRMLVRDRNAELDAAAEKLREKELGIPALTKTTERKKPCKAGKSKRNLKSTRR